MTPPRWVVRAALALAVLAAAPASASAAYRDDAVVRETLRQIPGVRDSLEAGRQLHAAMLVNRWLAPRIAAASGASAIVPTLGSSTHELLDTFAAGTGGVYCDGAADVLVASLRLLDIAAWRFDFGYATGALTHTTVVVAARGRYWLVDPTFALDLQDADGRPLDLVAAWQAAADGTRGAVTVRTGDLSARALAGGPPPGAVCANGIERWTMCALGTYLRSIAPEMERAGYPAGERGLLLLALRGPLLAAAFYGVPPELVTLRQGVRRESRPLRIVASARRGATVTVTVRNVRQYAVPAVVTVQAGSVTRSRAVVVPADAGERIALRLSAGGPRATARVTVRVTVDRDPT